MCSSSESEKKFNAPKWSSDQVIRFLEMFEGHELMWNAKHPDYANKNKRDLALMKLMGELEECGIPVNTIPILRQKIKTIRNTYRQEYLKVITSKQKSGSGTDDLYEPKLVWFKTANSFLREVVLSRSSSSNLVSTFYFQVYRLMIL